MNTIIDDIEMFEKDGYPYFIRNNYVCLYRHTFPKISDYREIMRNIIPYSVGRSRLAIKQELESRWNQ